MAADIFETLQLCCVALCIWLCDVLCNVIDVNVKSVANYVLPKDEFLSGRWIYMLKIVDCRLYTSAASMFHLFTIFLCHKLSIAFEHAACPRVLTIVFFFQLNYSGSAVDLCCIWLVLAGCWCIVHQDRWVCLCQLNSHCYSICGRCLIYLTKWHEQVSITSNMIAEEQWRTHLGLGVHQT